MEYLQLSKKIIVATRIAILLMVVNFLACTSSNIRAPEAYPTNIIPIDSKFQNCAMDCLADYSSCTNTKNNGFAKDLQADPVSFCRSTYQKCSLECRKKYNEIFN